ncbi:hypothetical protein B0H17DRAFT_1144244 [Mycena rosella]|uniref:Uncharacterized protein n=1 Tax=Mycena rosella TaxID=1033263 RepID=A0AAD7G6Y0_MYCRO|nr:hypothetical protein B0H17DRAFT_1144244 [Mycena rosella]
MSAEVELITGHINFYAGVGVIVDRTIAQPEFGRDPTKTGPFTVPGIFIIGPYITLDTGLGYEAGDHGKAVRNNIRWSDTTAKLDMVHPQNSFIGHWVQTKPVPLVNFNLMGTLKLDLFVSAALKFVVTIFNGKLEVTAGIEIKASLPVGIFVEFTVGNSGIQTVGCPGVTASLEAKLGILLQALERNERIRDPPRLLLEPIGPNQTYRTITAHAPVGGLQVS